MSALVPIHAETVDRRLFERDNGEPSEWLPLFLDFVNRIKIISKEMVEPAPMNMYGAQIRFVDEICEGLDRGVHHFTCLKARQLGACVAPDTRILTADLRWVAIKDIKVGDEIVSCDEHSPGTDRGGKRLARKMRTATVEATIRSRRKSYRMTFTDGRSVVCSGEHKWLSQKADTNCTWRKIEETERQFKRAALKPGDKVRWITTPWVEPDFEDGWFGGMLDGEGSLAKPSRKGTNICVSQLPGPVFERLKRYCEGQGFTHHIEDDASTRKTKYGKSPVPKVVISRLSDAFHVIGKTRPTRFIGQRFWEGKELPGKRSGEGWAVIASIEPLGEMDLCDLQTSTSTYIAEGFVSHNSTICLVLDIFWMWMFPGLQGALIFDTAENRDNAKETIEMMLENLPEGFKIQVARHNRNGVRFKNGSRLAYLSAGRRKNRGLAKSRGLNYVHASECGEWADQEGLESLLATLSEHNPSRLYIFESTAQGFNLFHEMCETAKKKPLQQKFFFIGWWAKELYSCPVGSPEYQAFWENNPRLSSDEQKTQDEVFTQFGHSISAEQWAWYRAMASEKAIAIVKQNYPSTPDEAFQSTGNAFFPLQQVAQDVAFLSTNAVLPRPYSVQLGENFTRMRIEDVLPGSELADLFIWEPPNARGRYVMGVDPATGEAEGKDPDRTVITIWRGYADKMVQVAEYATTNPTSQQCCWVMAYLAACYKDCIINLEKNGPGLAVMAEMRTLRQLIQMGELRDFTMQIGRTGALEGIRWFLYHRAESMGGDYIYNFTSNPKTKVEILNSLRDAYNTGKFVARSVPLLREMGTLAQTGGKIKGSGRNKDDRVLAGALAQRAWSEWLRPTMMADKRTWQKEMDAEAALQKVKTGANGEEVKVVDHIVKNFFTQQAVARQDTALSKLFNINY